MYSFTGTAEDVMDAFVAHVQKASTGGPDGYLYFHRALICLVGLHDRLVIAGAVDPARLAQFRHDSAAALTSFDGQIAAYVQETIAIAEDASEGEWLKLCYRRSAIQVVREDYAGSPAAAWIDEADLRALDRELERVGGEHGPVPERLVPRGLPTSHWWWRYPATPT
jgi:hypothetical protein